MHYNKIVHLYLNYIIMIYKLSLFSLATCLTTPIIYYSCSTLKQEENKRYNIVYIMSDDHTAQMMSCYDTRFVETPNIDRLAKDGVRFTNSFVANSISGPSRACLLTGKHSHINGFKDNETSYFDGNQQTFPKILKESGYETAIIGKWHLQSLPTGFNYWEILPGQGDYYNPYFITENDTIQNEGYVTNLITEKSIDWLENKRDKNKPFCLMIHHKAMHRNWMPELKNLPLYENQIFEIPDNFFDNYENRQAAAEQEMSIDKDMDLIYDLKMLQEGKDSKLKNVYLNILETLTQEERNAWDKFHAPIIKDFYNQKLSGRDLAIWKFQRYMKDYAKTLKSLDDNVGRILDYLEKSGLADNTIIIYTSDQGFYMGEHGWFDKRFMYEESMRTPLIMKLPQNMKKRGDINEMVQNIDHAATFLDLANIDIPSDIQGESYLPLLKGEKPTNWRKSLYYHFYEYPAEHSVKRHYGIRTERYKLIHFYNDIDKWELYDLKNDPKEMNNIYNQKGMEDTIIFLKKELLKLQELYKDTMAIKLN